MASLLQTMRAGGTEHPETIMNFLASRLVTVSGIFDISGTQFQVDEEDTPGMSVKVQQGYAFIVKSDLSMVYPVQLITEDGSVAITANSSGSTRNDAIVLYIDLSASPSATISNVAKLAAVAGTPGGAAPTDGDISTAIGASNPFIRLADVEVASGATSIVTANITDQRVAATYSTNIVPESILNTSSYAPQGFLINGKIVPSVASNNLTVAIKTLSGDDPSASNPVYVRIGDTVRTITAALSVTKNAGTNWMNAGSAELATKEIDYFVYLGYNATDGVVIGFSRIPYAGEYDDFSATTTNDKYCAISTITNAAAGDDYEVIGRFAATLSAGAGYTWTVPTFTNKNLIQRPIYETRWLAYTPVYTGFSSNPTGGHHRYKISYRQCTMFRRTGGGGAAGTSNTTGFTILAPISAITGVDFYTGNMGLVTDNSVLQAAPGRIYVAGNSNSLAIEKSYAGAAWTASGGKDVEFNNVTFEI